MALIPTDILSHIFQIVTESDISPPSIDAPLGAVVTREVALRPYNLIVCRSWQHALSITPVCWRNILIVVRPATFAEDDDRIAIRLERCGARCGIRVHITFPAWDIEQRVLNRLGNIYPHRIIGLELSRQSDLTITPMHDHALVLLDRSFPRLRYALVWDEWYRDEQNNLLCPILRSCPRLELFRELNSVDFTPRITQPDLTHVTIVVLAGTCNVRLRHLIHACPTLQQLYIEDHKFDSNTSAMPPQHITAPHLTILRIEWARVRAQYMPVPRRNPPLIVLFLRIELPSLASLDLAVYPYCTVASFLQNNGQLVTNLTLRGTYSSLRDALTSLNPLHLPVLRTLKLNLDRVCLASLQDMLIRHAFDLFHNITVDLAMCDDTSPPDQCV